MFAMKKKRIEKISIIKPRIEQVTLMPVRGFLPLHNWLAIAIFFSQKYLKLQENWFSLMFWLRKNRKSREFTFFTLINRCQFFFTNVINDESLTCFPRSSQTHDFVGKSQSKWKFRRSFLAVSGESDQSNQNWREPEKIFFPVHPNIDRVKIRIPCKWEQISFLSSQVPSIKCQLLDGLVSPPCESPLHKHIYKSWESSIFSWSSQLTHNAAM